MAFRILEEPLDGLKAIEPDVFGDHRGFFMEMWNKNHFEAIGLNLDLFQDNLSFSQQGILRGLHFQAPPYGQGKLVTVLEGQVLDVVVDIRTTSPTYGQHFAIELSRKNHLMVYIPPGFAHGFLVQSATALFHYKVSNSGYSRESEGGIPWNDPTLNIAWGIEDPVLSVKDKMYTAFDSFESPF